VVHRDIKPENVLIGEKLEVKVIDFSIATTKLQRFLSFLGRKAAGSPSYMPPEQILYRKSDPRSDIYSFGILAYELLTGRLPFQGRSMHEVFEKHCKEPPPSLSGVNGDVPREVADLVLSFLQKLPDKRPQDLRRAIYIIGKREMAGTRRLVS
jgi:serine/threonine-protein kinase